MFKIRKDRKQDKITSLTVGLFVWKWYTPRGFLKNIKDIFTMFKRIVFVIKHGYYPQAYWEAYNYFIEVADEVLDFFINDSTSYPNAFETCKDWEARCIIMKECLKRMRWDFWEDDWRNYINELPEYKNIIKDKNVHGYEEFQALQNDAKNQFMDFFNEYFYSFWD